MQHDANTPLTRREVLLAVAVVCMMLAAVGFAVDITFNIP